MDALHIFLGIIGDVASVVSFLVSLPNVCNIHYKRTTPDLWLLMCYCLMFGSTYTGFGYSLPFFSTDLDGFYSWFVFGDVISLSVTGSYMVVIFRRLSRTRKVFIKHSNSLAYIGTFHAYIGTLILHILSHDRLIVGFNSFNKLQGVAIMCWYVIAFPSLLFLMLIYGIEDPPEGVSTVTKKFFSWAYAIFTSMMYITSFISLLVQRGSISIWAFAANEMSCVLWFVYSLLDFPTIDFFTLVPNGVGIILTFFQLLFRCCGCLEQQVDRQQEDELLELSDLDLELLELEIEMAVEEERRDKELELEVMVLEAEILRDEALEFLKLLEQMVQRLEQQELEQLELELLELELQEVEEPGHQQPSDHQSQQPGHQQPSDHQTQQPSSSPIPSLQLPPSLSILRPTPLPPRSPPPSSTQEPLLPFTATTVVDAYCSDYACHHRARAPHRRRARGRARRRRRARARARRRRRRRCRASGHARRRHGRARGRCARTRRR